MEGTLTMARFGTVSGRSTVHASLLGLQVSACGRRGGALATLCALIIKAPRRSTEPKLQYGTLDLRQHQGGPLAYQDTCSFNFVPVAAGAGGPGWNSACIVCCVSDHVYSCLTKKRAEYRGWGTPGARHSGFDGRF